MTCILCGSVSIHLNHTLKSIFCRIILHYNVFGGYKLILVVKFEFCVFFSPNTIFFLVLKFICTCFNREMVNGRIILHFRGIRWSKTHFEGQIRNLYEKKTSLVQFLIRFAHDFMVIRASVKSQLLTAIGSQVC